MKKALGLLLYLFCFVFTGSALAQSWGIDTLQARMTLYEKINAQGLLYVHTDKTLYTNNEPIWFAGYLINSGLGDVTKHTIISVSLMRERDRGIIYEQQNVMENGLSSGSLIIPNNAPPGNYLFNACTNVLNQYGKPIAVFSQPITIKNISERRFNATLALLDTVPVNGMIRASVVVDIKDEQRKTKATISYTKGGNKTEKITLADKQSSAGFSVPVAQFNANDPILLTEVAYNYDTIYLSVKLPKVPQVKGFNVRFFPEGGDLTDGVESMVAIESQTTTGLQVALTGTLYNNGTPVETISTNSYGIGQFKLKPFKGNSYTFKIKANNYLDKDTTYALPNVKDNGVVMHFNEAVVNDTLRMTLYSKSKKKVQVALHNYREVFSLFETEARPEGKRLTVVLPTLPRGMAAVTLLNDGKPLAERLFFAHYNKNTTAKINTDKQQYDKRDSVGVTLTVKDHAGNPVKGILSVAAVQESRLEGAKQQDIETYFYLNYYLGTLPRYPMGRGFDNKPYLENMFLTHGWRRFNWQDMIQAAPADTLSLGPPPRVAGKWLHNGKPLKKPADMFMIRTPRVDKFATDADGSFVLKQEQLEVEEGRKVFLWTDMTGKIGYELTIENPFPGINAALAQQAPIVVRGTALIADDSSDQQLKGFEKKNILNEAVIRADKKEHMFGHANACGDYICAFHVLNCHNHTPWNSNVRPPVKGEVTTTGVYQGCTSAEPVPNIYFARQFYGLNRDPETSFEPQYLSTLFWEPGIATNEKGEATFHFFTSDVTGKYKIVIQGIGINGFINGITDVTVK